MHRLAMLVAIVALGCARAGQTPDSRADASVSPGAGGAASPPAAAGAARAAPDAALPNAEELRRDLAIFASDSFRGREAGTADELRAARFIADRAAALGLEAAGDSGYFFRYPVGARRGGTGGRAAGTPVGHNVVAIVRGSDPALARTYVALGAHLDHIGIQRPVRGDSIANGADDDGSGSMLLLALARTYSQMQPRPKRSILFVWHGGEEKGMLGSGYFTEHATVPRDSIVAQLNADMVGRNATDMLYVVGPAVAPNGQSRVLGRIVDSVNAAQPHPFRFNRQHDQPTDPEQIYFRSDHYSYARYGIPIVFFFSGLHEDYHSVDDEVERIDFEKLTRVGRLLFETATVIANSERRPK